MPTVLIADLIGQGVRFDSAEAVAIAQQLIAQLTGAVDLTSQPEAPLLGPPTPENVILGRDGSVVCLGCEVKPAVFEIAVLLQTLLPAGTAQVPGGLRYTIARGLLDVEAPPFDSIEEFSRALARFERGDRASVVRGVLARAAGHAPVHAFGQPRPVAAPPPERRRTALAATVLRRELQAADRRLYEQQAAAERLQPVITPLTEPAVTPRIEPTVAARVQPAMASTVNTPAVSPMKATPAPAAKSVAPARIVPMPVAPRRVPAIAPPAKHGLWRMPAVAAAVFAAIALAGLADLVHLRQSAATERSRVAAVAPAPSGEVGPASGERLPSDAAPAPTADRPVVESSPAVPEAGGASEGQPAAPVATPVERTDAPSAVARDDSGGGHVADAGPGAAALPDQRAESKEPSQHRERGTSGVAPRPADVSAASQVVAEQDGALVRALDDQHRPVFSPAFASSGTAMFFHTGSSRDAHSALAMATSPEGGGDLGIMTIVDDGARNYHVQPSPDGRYIAFDSDRDGERGVYVARRDGAEVRRISGAGYAAVPTWAPDGRRITYVRAETGNPKVWNLWMQPLDQTQARRLTNYRFGQPWSASWFPDNRRVSYTHEDKLVILDVETGRAREYSTPIKGRLVRTPAVSPDGTKVIFQVYRQGAWILDVANGSMNCVLTDPTAEEFAWAPDGQRVAFHSRRDGQWGIYILHQG